MADIRALCVGGSWAGRYRYFDVSRDASRTVSISQRDPVSATPDRYRLEFIRHASGNEYWFAIADDNTTEWALNQLMFAYSKMNAS